MSRMRRSLTLGILVFGLAGCGGESRPAFPNQFTPWSAPAFRYLGGWTREEDGALAAWSGATVEFLAPGGAVEVEISDEGGGRAGEGNYVNVLLNDEPTRRFALRPGRERYALGSIPAGTRVGVFKSTEPLAGGILFHGVHATEGLGAPPDARPMVAFIGDSITAGFGNLASNGRERFHFSTQDGAQAYGAQLARRLGWDYTARAWSGRGVWRNHDGSRAGSMAELWNLPVPLEGASLGLPIPEPKPNLVFVNLGTNDFASGQPEETAFVDAYARLLEAIRVEWGDIPVVPLLGPMLQDAVREGQSESDVALGRRFLGRFPNFTELAPSRPEEGFGAQFHPSLMTHGRMAKELLPVARRLIQKANEAPDSEPARESGRAPEPPPA